jgi:hypothetical protein
MELQSLPHVNDLLDQLEQTTVEPGDLTNTLQHIAQTARTFFAADACVIFAINPITNLFIESQILAGNQLMSNDRINGGFLTDKMAQNLPQSA